MPNISDFTFMIVRELGTGGPIGTNGLTRCVLSDQDSVRQRRHGHTCYTVASAFAPLADDYRMKALRTDSRCVAGHIEGTLERP